MKRKRLAALLIVAIAFVVVVVLPVAKVRRLAVALKATPDEATAADICWELLRCGRWGRFAVARFAADHALAAFDARHGVLIFHDETEPRTHILYAGPHGAPANTGDPALDAAVDALMSGTEVRQSVTGGDPPQVFERVELVGTGEDHCTFLLKAQEGDVYGSDLMKCMFLQSRFVGIATSDFNEDS